MKRAYEFALNETGNDLYSSDIWKEYIAFLQEKEVSIASRNTNSFILIVLLQATNAWEIQQQQDTIRKVYHRAVVIPLQDVEQLWREYDQFENKINKMTVRSQAVLPEMHFLTVICLITSSFITFWMFPFRGYGGTVFVWLNHSTCLYGAIHERGYYVALSTSSPMLFSH